MIGMAYADSDGTRHTKKDSTSTTGTTSSTATNSNYVVLATNDLGMHCACPGADTFLLLPPFNTLRAQVIKRGDDPTVITDPNQITVTYSIIENTDASLKSDPYFQDWIANSPKLFPGFQPIRADGRIQGLTGATLSGQMSPQAGGYWEVKGIPAYPNLDPNGVMIDPLGGPKRNPYLTGNVKVYSKSNGALLAQVNTVVPVGFGGCCGCHLKVATDYGRVNPTPRDSFEVMGMLHARSSGIDFSKIDPDGDGIGGPIRCSRCHLDPAMGESVAPGYTGYPTSKYTLSDVLHRWHVQSQAVQVYDPNIANDCYQCHPGNGVNCYRDHHTNETINGHNIWCSDCHGDLNQRVASGQLLKPWSDQTLPTCSKCHSGTGEGGGYLNTGLFGKFLNSRGHKDNKILCSSCHGEPHALYPSTLAKDNAEPLAIQNDSRAIGKCSVCHTNQGNSWGKPPHGGD
jgi:hypothetical protein